MSCYIQYLTVFTIFKVLESLFPNPDIIEAEGMEIQVKIMSFNDIKWTSRLSLTERFFHLRNVPSKPLKVIHKWCHP